MSNTQPPRLWAIIPAAGGGTRMQAQCPKQYLHIGSRTVLEITLDKILSVQNIERIVVPIDLSDSFFSLLNVVKHPRVNACMGGRERSDSVLSGLRALKDELDAQDHDWVLVHDAARPCVAVDKIESLIQNVLEVGQGGVLAHPVADTIKTVDDECVVNTVDRSVLWHAHTPQMFRLGELISAITHAKDQNLTITDESSAMEASGHPVIVVSDRRDNIKITYPEDLFLAEKILSQQNG